MTPITTLEQPGLQRLLEADSAQAALDAAVDMVAHIFNGTAVGVLRLRAEYISSASVDNESPLRSALFMEALRVLNKGHCQDTPADEAGLPSICCIPIYSGEQLVSVIAVSGADVRAHLQSQVSTIQLAFSWAVQHIRRTSETRLLYDISLRFSGKNTNGQLLGDVLMLVNETFKARASRIFLVDRRTNDLAMLLSSSFAGTRQPGEYVYHNDALPAAPRSPSSHRLDNFLQFLHHDGNIHLIEPLRVPLQGSIAGAVVAQGQSVIHNRAAPETLPHLVLEAGITQAKLLCVPLRQVDDVVGALMVINRGDDPDFTTDDEQLLAAIGSIMAIMLANARLYQRAIRDALTGAYNRAAFETSLDEQWQRWRETNAGFTLLILDLDDFKRINDHFGHIAGDAVLQAVTQILWEALRDEDTIFRYGGEEFCVILDNVVDAEQALRIANRLRSSLDRDIRVGGVVTVSISASIGVAIHPLHDAQTPHLLIALADDAAYTAKRSGKNRVELARRAVATD